MKKINLFLFCLFFSVNAFSDSTLVFSGNDEKFVGEYIYILKDETNQLSFQEIQKSSGFIKSSIDVPNIGPTTASVWVKLTIKNVTENEDLILELHGPLIDKAELYSPDKGGNYLATQLGQNKPFNARKYKHINYMFDLQLYKGETATYYLKLNSYDPLGIPIKISTPLKAFESVAMQNFIFGIYAGLMVIMILYNLFIYFTVRDKSYLFYVLYIFSVLLTQATFLGYTFKYLWPNNPDLEVQSIVLVSIFVGFASVQFLRVFLNTKVIVPKYDKVFLFAYVLYGIALVIAIMGLRLEAWTLVSMIVTPLSIYMLFVSIKISRMGNRTATFFATAWVIFLVGVFIHAFKDFGILPYNYFTKYTMPLGSAIETILLSFALADRIKVLQQEKQESQVKVLEALKENERIIKEQNVVLEAKVDERTVELQKSNQELNVTLKNLKDAQSQLVNSEKMASLGQLTAGVAHEINNPINFVSSSIKPLKRDIGDLLNILSKYEELNEVNLKEKVKEINDLKTELDMDYLKAEIDSLLKGIDDGATRTAEIVKGLKTFSRIDETDLKRVDLNEGIDSTLILLSSVMNGKIQVVKEYGDISKIECYAGKINQVFMNIISNAIHAIHNNKANDEGMISIKTMEKADDVVIHIKDNGTGIPEDIRSKIFDPFFTTKDVGEGTGLGLSIVYNIIESHKGKIELQSELGKGAEFIITLPKLQS